jgi:hypothetical protein
MGIATVLWGGLLGLVRNPSQPFSPGSPRKQAIPSKETDISPDTGT